MDCVAGATVEERGIRFGGLLPPASANLRFFW